MTQDEYNEAAALVVRLRKDLELHTDALKQSNAHCGTLLVQNEQLHSELVEVRSALAATTEQRDSLKRTLDEWSNADTTPHARLDPMSVDFSPDPAPAFMMRVQFSATPPVKVDDVADHVVPPALNRGEPDPANDAKDAKLEFRNGIPSAEMIDVCQWWDVVGTDKAIRFKRGAQHPAVWRSAGDFSQDRWKHERCPQPLKPHGMTWQELDTVLANEKASNPVRHE